MFEDRIWSEDELAKVKAKVLQVCVSMKEKVCIVEGLQGLGYGKNFSAGIRDVVERYMAEEYEGIPHPHLNLDGINAIDERPTWIVIRVSPAFKARIKKAREVTFKGEREYLLTAIRTILGYRIDVNTGIVSRL